MLKNVFIEVLNLSFIGSFVILIILFARVFLKKAPTKYAYILWSVALIRLILPFSIESILSILFVNPKPISQNIVYSETPLINTGITVLDRTVNGSLPASEVVASVNPMQIWVLLGSIIWIIGMIFLFTYGITSLVKIKKELQRSTWISENIYSSNAVRTPFVLGLLLPKIYLPNFISETETEYIILHERTHINRRDHIIRFASYLVLCLHWFNPLVWLAFYISGKDMEMSCDESVIKQLGYDLKKDYSQSLLNFTIGTRSFCITPLAFGEGDTKGRIRNILNLRPPKFYVIAIAILIVLLVSIGLLSNPINDDLDEQILSGADMAEAVDLIGTVIISEVEVADGKEYEILLTNDSSYTIYELKIALSYPIIITNGHRSNKDSIEADEVVKRVESGSSDIVTVFIPTAYYYEKNYDTGNLEIELTGYLDEVVSIKQFGKIGKIGKIEANYSADSEDWIQEASNKPIQAVRAALLNQEAKDFTISMGIGSIDIDSAETQSVINRYLGSELAQSRGWSDDYLQEHFVVVKANYEVEYDHTKTFMSDGNLEQYFYLTEDIDTGLWTIVDHTSTESLTIIGTDPSEGNLDFAIRYTQLYGYEQFIILSSSQESLTVLAYHGNNQTLTAATLESAVITIDKTANDSVKEEIFLNEELTGYMFTPKNPDASYQNYIVGIRYRRLNTNPSTFESAIVIIPKSDLSALSVYESFEQSENSQGPIPPIIDMTLNVEGQYLSYQDLDEYFKVYDILNDSLYSVEDQLDHLSVDYSNFTRYINGTSNDYQLPIIYLITSANGEDLVFNTVTLEFVSLNDKDSKMIISNDNYYTAILSHVDDMQHLELIDREGNTIFSYGYNQFLTEIIGIDFSELQWQLSGFDESSAILWGGFGGELDTVAHFIYNIESEEFIVFDQSNQETFIEYLNIYPAVR